MNNFKLLLISAVSLSIINLNLVNAMDSDANTDIHKNNTEKLNITNNVEKINKENITELFNNVKNNKELMYENIKMQLESLILDESNEVDFSKNDIIQLIINVIDDFINENNNNYQKLKDQCNKILYISINYYLWNIEQYNDNLKKYYEGVNGLIINILKNQFDRNQFSEAVKILNNNKLYNALNKIVKGINSLTESINKNNNQDNIYENNVIHFSNGSSKCFLVSAVQQFIGILRQSEHNSSIRKTNFASFIKYLEESQNKTKNKIDFIKELRKYTEKNKNLFDTESQKQALNCLFVQENNIQSIEGTAGMLGDVFILRIFPELQKFIGGNKMQKKDILLDAVKNFELSSRSDISMHNQFDSSEYGNGLLNAYLYKCRYPFSNCDYIISALKDANIKDVIQNKKYISFYDDNNKLNIYELIGIQLRTELGNFGHYTAYVKQAQSNNSWSYIDSLKSSSKDNNNLEDILEEKTSKEYKIIDPNDYMIHQAVYKKVK